MEWVLYEELLEQFDWKYLKELLKSHAEEKNLSDSTFVYVQWIRKYIRENRFRSMVFIYLQQSCYTLLFVTLGLTNIGKTPEKLLLCVISKRKPKSLKFICSCLENSIEFSAGVLQDHILRIFFNVLANQGFLRDQGILSLESVQEFYRSIIAKPEPASMRMIHLLDLCSQFGYQEVDYQPVIT